MEEAKLISDMTHDQKIDTILLKVANMERKVDRMETAMAGDEELGVEGLVDQFEKHEDLDNKRHDENSKRLDKLTKSFDDEKSFRRGAYWVIGILVVVVNIIIAIVK